MKAPERHVLFVPGKNPKPPPALHREVLWRCIAAGARDQADASAADMQALSARFHIAGWNRLYYGADADIGGDLPWVAHMLATPEPDPVARLGPWKIRRTRFVYTLGDLFPFLTRLAADADARATLEETRRYFDNAGGVAERIRETVKDALRPLFQAGHRVMLIGHSLGSVIAYDVLWELAWKDAVPWRVDRLLTLGSPLGMFYVQRRLAGHGERGARRYPTNVRHWTNVSAAGDLMALDRHLRNDFHEMLELGLAEDITDYTHGIEALFPTAEGPNPHRCYGYFFNPLVARAITGWMRGEPRVDARPW
ncbi:MAG: hypothetical protein ACM3ZT_03170 [Bacillota bacterium]